MADRYRPDFAARLRFPSGKDTTGPTASSNGMTRVAPPAPVENPRIDIVVRLHPAARLPLDALAVVLLEVDLAQPNCLRRDLDQFVLFDVLQRRLQRELPRRLDRHRLLRPRRPHVRQLLL